MLEERSARELRKKVLLEMIRLISVGELRRISIANCSSGADARSVSCYEIVEQNLRVENPEGS